MRELRTDLASEFAKPVKISDSDICKITGITLNAQQARKYGKAAGRYITVETRAVSDGLASSYGRVSAAVAKTLKSYFPKPESVLVAGLGNADMTADALGCFVANRINISCGKLYAIRPGVTGSTGLESFDTVKGLCDRINPSLVIAIDSLAAAAADRVCNVFQFSDGGITPGSGVSNHRKTLSKDTLGVPVISVGVPLVVYATTIIDEACGGSGSGPGSDFVRSLIVTPKDIDILVRDCAKIIADGINAAYS